MSHATVHEIVSNADTIIYLKNPCESFAEWIESVPTPAVNDWGFAFKSKKDKKKKKSKKSKIEEPPPPPPPPPPLDNVDADKDNAEPSIPDPGPSVESEDALPAESIQIEEPTDVVEPVLEAVETPPDAPAPCVEARPIEFRVCAGNLMSASPWFNRTLKKDGWMESTREPGVHWYQIDASDWDEEAFVIMMNIFHLRNSLVPRDISLEMLAKIAVLADYYECDESLSLWVDIWISHLEATSPIPKSYCRDLILWMWISWAFRLPTPFKRSTAVAVEQATGPVRTLELPIPAWIINKLDLQRQRAIEHIIFGLEAQLIEYSDAAYNCPRNDDYSFLCGSMLLGALTKKMGLLSLRSAHLESPYLGKSVRTICDAARTIDSEVWYHGNSGYHHGYGSSYNQHPCKLSSVVGPLVNSAVAGVEGLDLRRTTSD